MPLGPAQQYLVEYNTYTLPGYLQEEDFNSEMTIASHYAPYADGSPSEYTGLQNKIINLKLRVWEQDFASCKDQIRLAATYLRSNRSGYSVLRVKYPDRHYMALTRSIKEQNTAGRPVRIADYFVTLETQPWLISDATYTISGNALNGGLTVIDTDQVSRTLSEGGYTPTYIKVSGKDITISGYTSTVSSTGFISVSGIVTSLIVDSDAYSSTEGVTDRNDIMLWVDYQTFIGPGKTSFAISGAYLCEISYNNRWYL